MNLATRGDDLLLKEDRPDKYQRYLPLILGKARRR